MQYKLGVKTAFSHVGTSHQVSWKAHPTPRHCNASSAITQWAVRVGLFLDSLLFHWWLVLPMSRCLNSVFLQLWSTKNNLERLLKHSFPCPDSRDSDLVGLRWSRNNPFLPGSRVVLGCQATDHGVLSAASWRQVPHSTCCPAVPARRPRPSSARPAIRRPLQFHRNFKVLLSSTKPNHHHHQKKVKLLKFC